MPLSTQPYKGARDFYPEDKRVQNYMFSIWRAVAERYGYEEYDAPILEPLDIYLAKSGEEIVNEQTYTFEDRGGRQVVIRPEMTPTVSRMVAGKRQELGYPVRWFSIPNLWRYERPQRGRLREHWQLNVDIFGVAGLGAEQEMITLVDDMFKTFGAKPDMYEIKLNSRQLMNFILEQYLRLGEAEAHKVAKLIDRMHKLERSDFVAKLDQACTPEQREAGAVQRLLTILDAHTLGDLPPEIAQNDAATALSQMIAKLNAAGITNAVYDPSLMRGFDYYTGIVFEVADTDPENNRSMLGGGRYDGLVGLFGVEPVPTVGFGWGDVTLENFLRSHSLLPALVPSIDYGVLLVGDVDADELLADLRAHGLKLAVDISGRKLGDQFKAAEKRGLQKVLIVGADEVASGQLKLKDLASGDEQTVRAADLMPT